MCLAFQTVGKIELGISHSYQERMDIKDVIRDRQEKDCSVNFYSSHAPLL